MVKAALRMAYFSCCNLYFDLLTLVSRLYALCSLALFLQRFARKQLLADFMTECARAMCNWFVIKKIAH